MAYCYSAFVFLLLDGEHIMCSGSQLGHVAMWDLEKRKLHSQLLSAHNAPVTGLKCLPSEPLMVTSSIDNSIKVSTNYDGISSS